MFMDCDPYPGPTEHEGIPGYESLVKSIERDMRLSLLAGYPGATYDVGSIYKISAV